MSEQQKPDEVGNVDKSKSTGRIRKRKYRVVDVQPYEEKKTYSSARVTCNGKLIVQGTGEFEDDEVPGSSQVKATAPEIIEVIDIETFDSIDSFDVDSQDYQPKPDSKDFKLPKVQEASASDTQTQLAVATEIPKDAKQDILGSLVTVKSKDSLILVELLSNQSGSDVRSTSTAGISQVTFEIGKPNGTTVDVMTSESGTTDYAPATVTDTHDAPETVADTHNTPETVTGTHDAPDTDAFEFETDTHDASETVAEIPGAPEKTVAADDELKWITVKQGSWFTIQRRKLFKSKKAKENSEVTDEHSEPKKRKSKIRRAGSFCRKKLNSFIDFFRESIGIRKIACCCCVPTQTAPID